MFENQKLKVFPVDRLKIDQSFIRDVAISHQDAAIADTILALARHLDFEVIAEGVETEAQVRTMRAQGCRLAQGYYFSHPLPPEALAAWLDWASGSG